jgi:radical SAM superfamily enzyme YgiQ (UPF0313 family)
MNYEGSIYRPPSEAGSLILQVTVGCRHNKCTFCGSYREKKFRIKSLEQIEEDLKDASRMGRVRRIFLADGDALCIPQKRLIEILKRIGVYFPDAERIGIYASAKDVIDKGRENLKVLKDLGLGIIYLGVETGSEQLLEKIKKGCSYEDMVRAAKEVKAAGIDLSVTVLLGIGGVEQSREHAMGTAKILTEMDPEYVGALSVMLVPGTELHEEYERGAFKLPDPFGLIEELKIMIENSSFTNCVFRSNHASNYLPIKATLPGDKEKVLRDIDRTLKERDQKGLRPEFLRAL